MKHAITMAVLGLFLGVSSISLAADPRDDCWRSVRVDSGDEWARMSPVLAPPRGLAEVLSDYFYQINSRLCANCIDYWGYAPMAPEYFDRSTYLPWRRQPFWVGRLTPPEIMDFE